MKYFIYQGNDHDCGFATLKMYLATIAKDKSYLYIPKPSKREHYSLEDLVNIASDYNVPLEACTCSKDYFDNLDAPSIVLIDDNHAVLIKRKYKHSVVLYDPGRGVVRMRREEFLRRWRNIILSSDNPELVKKLEKKRQHLLPLKLDILTNVIAILSAVSLIVTFYLLNKSENFLFSFIFLCLFVAGQIAEKAVLYKQVYTFDLEYIPRYFNYRQNCSKEKYLEYVNYKRQFFVKNRQQIASVLIAFMITFLLILNDYRNVFSLLVLVLIKLLEILVFSRNEQDTKNYITELESRSFKDPRAAKDLALQANVKADGHILYNSMKDIFYIFVSFGFAVIMMFITKNMGCNFVIFHFVMYFAGFNAYAHLLEGISSRKDSLKMERRFFDSCNL